MKQTEGMADFVANGGRCNDVLWHAACAGRGWGHMVAECDPATIDGDLCLPAVAFDRCIARGELHGNPAMLPFSGFRPTDNRRRC